MVTPVYPASNNQQAIDLNISNANQFFTILQGGIDDFIPTYEGNGEIPSVAKALNEAAAYKVPLAWQTTSEETDLLQPREYNGDIYVPLSVPAPFSGAPSNSFWRLYSEKSAQILIDNLTFTGDGVTTDFSIPSMVVDDPAAYLVSVDGVDQRPTIDYTVNVGTDTLSFTEAPPATEADNISVTVLGALKGALAEGIYETAVDGLDETVDGGFFHVVNTSDPEAFVDLYKNNAGSALLIDTYPNSVAYNNLANAVAYEADLADNSVGNGSDKLAHTGTSDTVTEALDKRTIFVGSVSELEALPSPTTGQEAIVSGCPFKYDGASWKATRHVTPEAFGAVEEQESTSEIQAALDFIKGTGIPLVGNGKRYLISEGGTSVNGRNYLLLTDDGIRLHNIKFALSSYSAASYFILKETTSTLTYGYEFKNVEAVLKDGSAYVHNGIRLYGHVGDVHIKGCKIEVRGDPLSIIGMENYEAPTYTGMCENEFIYNNEFYSDEQNGVFLLGNQKHVRVRGNRVNSRADNGASKVGIFIDNMETGGYSVPGGDLWSNPIATDGQIASKPIRDVIISGNKVEGFKNGVVVYSAEDCSVVDNPSIKAGVDGVGVIVENVVSSAVANHENWDYQVSRNRIEARTGVFVVNSSDSLIKDNKIKGSSVAGNTNLRGIYVFDRSSTQSGARSDNGEISGNRITSISGNNYTNAISVFVSPNTRDQSLSSNLASGSFNGNPFDGVTKNQVAEFSGNISLDQSGGNVLARIQYIGPDWEVITSSKSFGIENSQLTWNVAGYLEIDLDVSTGVTVVPANTSVTCSVDFIESAPNICRVRFYDSSGTIITTENTNLRFVLRVGT